MSRSGYIVSYAVCIRLTGHALCDAALDRKETLKKMGGVVAAIDLAESTYKQYTAINQSQQHQSQPTQHHANGIATQAGSVSVAAALDSLDAAVKINSVDRTQLQELLRQRFGAF
jgi:hypothetical protein